MPETTAMPSVHLHYWAGAKAAAGTSTETVEAASVRAALEAVQVGHADERFSRVVGACSLLVDGLVARGEELDRVLDGPVRVEVLPPFAGGRR